MGAMDERGQTDRSLLGDLEPTSASRRARLRAEISERLELRQARLNAAIGECAGAFDRCDQLDGVLLLIARAEAC
jgi:hypothetical protein